jgi:alpha-glucuronidase
VFAPEDGKYRESVIIVGKASPLDWDFSAPIPALDGAIARNGYGSEWVIAKNWPLSWFKKWKWWLEQDTYRAGPGSLHKRWRSSDSGTRAKSTQWRGAGRKWLARGALGRLRWIG